MLLYLCVFLVALLSTFLLTPVVKNFAPRIGALDKPGHRKIHVYPIPRLGGLAIYPGFTLALFTGMLWALFAGMKISFLSMFGIILGGTLLLVVGIIDDIKGLSALTKLAFQIVASVIAILAGVHITFLSIPLSGRLVLGFFSLPLTLFWLVGITNTVNLIDGLDGLAAGISAIASVTLFIVAIRTHQLGAAIMLAALAGSAIGFLRYNFNPASIFLGDSGALFLGFLLAAVSITGVLKSTLVIALVIPILILGIPIYDTASAIFRRLRARQPIFKADQGHIHHNLLREGFTQKEAVISIYLVCVVLSLGALLITAINAVQAVFILPLIIIFGFVSLIWVKSQIRKMLKGNAAD